MALPARKFETESFMDDRIARLEEKTDHMQEDVAEIKADIRRIDATIAALKDSVNELRIEMKDAVADLRISRWIDRVWWLLISGALLGVMARGFKWI